MKTTIMLKEFSALSFDAGRIATTSMPANSGSQPQQMPNIVRRFAGRQARRVEDFREMLHRRETTPFASAISWHRSGINE
jgi:hypothetical protein